MSNSEDDEGFDKEAERERLREQYEREQERREATRRMSDLLLKGATMTNQHCADCGSPIFRHDGEEFCPTCGGTRDVEAAADDAGDAEGPDSASGPPAGSADAQAAGSAGGADAGAGAEPPGLAGEAGEARPDAPGGADAARATSGDDGDASDREDTRREADEGAPDARADAEAGPRDGEPIEGASPPSGGSRERPPAFLRGADVEDAPSLAQAKASLRRAVVSLAEQAAQSDDPARAHALLEGAREAAEALAALGGDA